MPSHYESLSFDANDAINHSHLIFIFKNAPRASLKHTKKNQNIHIPIGGRITPILKSPNTREVRQFAFVLGIKNHEKPN